VRGFTGMGAAIPGLYAGEAGSTTIGVGEGVRTRELLAAAVVAGSGSGLSD
jgi:hypothetical protein